MKIVGIEGISQQQLDAELRKGGKFVIYQYCVSVLILTFRRPSSIYFIRSGQSAVGKGIGFTLLSFLAGWWGIPWGPIYTIQSITRNLGGGRDVTREVLNSFQQKAA
jgi:hypothetical protein